MILCYRGSVRRLVFVHVLEMSYGFKLQLRGVAERVAERVRG